MIGGITWVFDCGDGVCIEREQPSTALRPMPHFTTYGGTHFSAGPDVYHPEFQPELNDFEIPHGPHFHGHDPVTGLDTGSGNDPIVHHVGSTAGPGGSSYMTGIDTVVVNDIKGEARDQEHSDWLCPAGSNNRFVFEPMDVMPNLGESIDPGLDAAGGFQPHEVTAVQIGQPPDPKLWLHTLG